MAFCEELVTAFERRIYLVLTARIRDVGCMSGHSYTDFCVHPMFDYTQLQAELRSICNHVGAFPPRVLQVATDVPTPFSYVTAPWVKREIDQWAGVALVTNAISCYGEYEERRLSSLLYGRLTLLASPVSTSTRRVTTRSVEQICQRI